MMYLGCSTAGNRAQWALFGVLSLLCAVLWIVSRAERSSCQLCDIDGDMISNCKALRAEHWNDWDASVQKVTGCSIRVVSGTFLGGLVSLMLAIIPLGVMACTRKPEDQLASHTDLLRQSLQFYTGQPSDITQHATLTARTSAAADNGAGYSAMYNAMYN